MELDMTVVITGKHEMDLVDLQNLLKSKTEDGTTVMDLEKVLPSPKGLHPVPMDRNAWTEKDWAKVSDNNAMCGSESLYLWKVDNWGTTYSLISTTGLHREDLSYDEKSGTWKMELSMEENILPVLDVLANRFPQLDFVVTLFERDGVMNKHFEYRLCRTFYNSLYQASDSMGMEYEEKATADGKRVVTRDTVGEALKEVEEPMNTETDEGGYVDVEIPM